MASINIPVYVTMALDPALTASASSDFNGITIVGTAPDGTWYVMEADNFKGVPNQVIERCARYAQLYKPRVFSLEAIAAQILFRPLLVPALRDAGVHPSIYEYRTPPHRSKAQRIEALQPHFKSGRIVIREGLGELIDQLERYPEVDHDDLLDSLAQHLEISRIPHKGEVHPSIGRDWYEDFQQYGPGDSEERPNVPADGTYTGRHGTPTRATDITLLDLPPRSL